MDAKRMQVCLGQVIRARRSKLGHSQESFADTVDLHRTYIGSIERGERNVGLRNLLRIAKALDTDLSELIAETERLCSR